MSSAKNQVVVRSPAVTSNSSRLGSEGVVTSAGSSMSVWDPASAVSRVVELDCFTAGQALDTVASPAGLLGPMLYFEHAFPDIATTLALAGAQILVIPSAVPYGFEHLLELRTRARAQDNQVFAVGCNMVGHGFCGRSLVTDPTGEVVVSAGEAETVLRARLDLGAIEQERAREPALGLRRPELYLPLADDD